MVVGFVAASAALTWDWFDADEFVNLQQAQRANAGHPLYTDTPSNHPPLYTWTLQGVLKTGLQPLTAARLLSITLLSLTLLLTIDILRHALGRLSTLAVAAILCNVFVVVAASRAMNETLLLTLATFALWLNQRSPLGSGIAWGLAGLARVSAVFFAPVVLARPHPRKAIAAGLVTAALLLLLVPRAAWHDMLQQVVLFHKARDGEPFLQRLAKWLGYSGIPVLAWIAWRYPAARDWSKPWPRAGLILAIASAGTLLLNVVHVHYFLPLMLFTSGAIAWWLHQVADEVRAHRGEAAGAQAALVRLVPVLVVSAGLLLGYMAMTPDHDLGTAHEVAAQIEAHVPAGSSILTDAPQYAVLSHRANLGGYYWSLRTQSQPWLNATKEASVVVVSERFGHYDRGFHPDVLASLSSWTCLQAPGARIYIPQPDASWPYSTCQHHAETAYLG
jgi:hypothetical protein